MKVKGGSPPGPWKLKFGTFLYKYGKDAGKSGGMKKEGICVERRATSWEGPPGDLKHFEKIP